MHAERWHVVGGQVYRLANVFATSREAVIVARLLRSRLYVVISRDEDGFWAVYWRPKTNPAESSTGCCGVTRA